MQGCAGVDFCGELPGGGTSSGREAAGPDRASASWLALSAIRALSGSSHLLDNPEGKDYDPHPTEKETRSKGGEPWL